MALPQDHTYGEKKTGRAILMKRCISVRLHGGKNDRRLVGERASVPEASRILRVRRTALVQPHVGGRASVRSGIAVREGKRPFEADFDLRRNVGLREDVACARMSLMGAKRPLMRG
jgi:hypothetical protein